MGWEKKVKKRGKAFKWQKKPDRKRGATQEEGGRRDRLPPAGKKLARANRKGATGLAKLGEKAGGEGEQRHGDC